MLEEYYFIFTQKTFGPLEKIIADAPYSGRVVEWVLRSSICVAAHNKVRAAIKKNLESDIQSSPL